MNEAIDALILYSLAPTKDANNGNSRHGQMFVFKDLLRSCVMILVLLILHAHVFHIHL